MKKIFDNKQVCHVWASQSQDSGSNSSKSIYFRGTTIFSYGNHFPMAKIYDQKGMKFALVNSDRYSITTQKHLNDTRSALHGRMQSLDVPKPDDLNHQDNEDYLLNEVSDLLSDVFRGKFVAEHRLFAYINEVNRLYMYQNKVKRFDFDHLTSEVVTELIKKATEKDQVKQQIKEVKRLAQEEKEKAFYALQIPLWLQNKNEKHIPSHVFPFDMVRITGNEVETSRGAKVPLQRACELIRLIDLKLPIEGLKVGSFEIESEPIDDFIKIGCHKINLTQTRKALSNG